VPTSERVGKNEALFREVNERIRDVSARLVAYDGAAPIEFLCECSDEECSEPIELTLAEYDAVRSEPTHFVVAIGHLWRPDLERAVRVVGAYAVIEKLGASAQVAVEEDGA
jgi:hypothetical protein